jgi:branched-chain amino acid transport system substrate-binding protein
MNKHQKVLYGSLGTAILIGILVILLWPKQSGDVWIGAVLPLTGSAAVWGQNAKMGMDLAVQEINASGGINGTSVVIVYEDSQSDPRMATSALQKLITYDRSQVVIGDIASSSVLAMAPIAEKNRVVLLSPGASNPDISNAGEFIFRNWQSDALEGDVDATFAWETLGWRRVAILYIDNAFGTAIQDVFARRLRSLGGEIVSAEGFAQGGSDFRAQLTKLQSISADGLYLPGYPQEVAQLLKQKQELGIRLPALSTQSFDDPQILSTARNAAEGVIFSVPKPPDTSDPVVSRFREAYIAAYQQEPGVCSDSGYDAVRIVAWAIERAGEDGPAIQRQLTQLRDFPGAAGITTFDDHGDVVKPFVFKIVRDGQFAPYERGR